MLDELDVVGRPLRAVLLGIDVEAFTPAVETDTRLLKSPLVARYLDHAAQPGCGSTTDARFENVLWELRMGRDEPDILRDTSGSRRSGSP